MIEAVQDLGLCSRGSGADNIRNVTGTPTAGVDPQELIDTRPFAREWHFHILNDRSLYGLPRKFNVAFDGAGTIAVLEDTNDIALAAAQIRDGFGAAPGIWYRLGLGGITGHRDFARDTGVIVKPADAVRVCNAIIRVFIGNGDRTDRTKARLKYLLDRWGLPKFLEAVEQELGEPLTRVDPAAILPRPPIDKHGHIGVHEQKQPGLHYIGVVFPVGRVSSERLRGLAAIAEQFGSGTIRLTVWQNCLISDIPAARVKEALAAIEALGLDWRATAIRGGLVACTGNAGCKFSASNTKRDAAMLAAFLERHITIDHPINIHLTGCHHSCAQHYAADIGLLATKIEQEEDMVEGYDLLIGGGAGPDQQLGRLVRAKVVTDELPDMILALLRAWQDRRGGPQETFQAFATRHSEAELAALTRRETVAA
jgi:ferredoxin-nitrite reductase